MMNSGDTAWMLMAIGTGHDNNARRAGALLRG